MQTLLWPSDRPNDSKRTLFRELGTSTVRFTVHGKMLTMSTLSVSCCYVRRDGFHGGSLLERCKSYARGHVHTRPYFDPAMSNRANHGTVQGKRGFYNTIRNPYGDVMQVKLQTFCSRQRLGKDKRTIENETMLCDGVYYGVTGEGDATLASSAVLFFWILYCHDGPWPIRHINGIEERKRKIIRKGRRE